MNTEVQQTDQSEREQNVRLVRDSADGLLKGRGGISRMRSQRFTAQGFDRAIWSEICEMGWLGMRLPEEIGGSGMGMLESVQVALAAGTHLVPEPLISGMCTSALLDEVALEQYLSGAKIFVPAWQEATNSLDPVGGDTQYSEGTVTGRKRFVWQGSEVDGFVVSTPQGCMLVEAKDEGVSIHSTPTQDGGHWADIELNRAVARPLPGNMSSSIEEAALLEASYLLGSAQAALSMTLEFMNSRKQFDKPIGSFQALQHRAADLKIFLALSEASVENAARAFDAQEPLAVRQAAVSRAKARCSDTALLVTRQAVQLHGAIGYTDEYDVGLFLRSAMCHSVMAGSSAVHRARFGQLCC
ncbi:acyl-CoA dehydrogenase family protein [Glaciimonas sp. PCH181]|uniref:acyl-CoA dehydrogenase family protein n=1 Tax=Glaciimonas sp. PCH181 TaxID=2133943 RepID=UPI000D3BABF7|nr:acyl-CoA dehydrogenase family protein [Glaciimonas sp. PCH181]PUA19549.1 acyl-CoA dehydrogenase [Glaciimonas sp. PCH181]